VCSSEIPNDFEPMSDYKQKDIPDWKLKARAMSAPWNRGIDVLLRSGDSIVTGLTATRRDDLINCDPSFTLDIDDAQTLMDDLWHCGLRPTDGAGSAGAMAATQKHLDDMRDLVFKTGRAKK